MEEAQEVTCNLITKFEYAFKGDLRQAEFITLTPPTMKQHHQAAALKQSIMRTISSFNSDSDDDENASEEGKSKEDEKITSKMIIQIIYGGSVEVNVIWGQVRELLRTGVALIDGEEKLTIPLMDKMHPDDFENLAGEYIANFTLA